MQALHSDTVQDHAGAALRHRAGPRTQPDLCTHAHMHARPHLGPHASGRTTHARCELRVSQRRGGLHVYVESTQVPPTRASRMASTPLKHAPLPRASNLARCHGPQPASPRAAAAVHSRPPRRSATGRCCRLGPFTHRSLSRDANGADRRTDPSRRSVGVQRQDAILRDMRRGHGDSAPITRFVRGSVAAHSRSARRPRARPRRPRRPHSSIGSEARSRETGNSPCRRPPAPAAPRGIGGAPVPTYAASQRPIPTCAGACECGCEYASVPFGRGAHGVCCRCP